MVGGAAGRWVIVLVCYLDDSGKDRQNRITTLAGYVAKDDDWQDFENAVEPIFAHYGVKVLHTKDLHHTDGEFDGWPVLKNRPSSPGFAKQCPLACCLGWICPP